MQSEYTCPVCSIMLHLWDVSAISRKDFVLVASFLFMANLHLKEQSWKFISFHYIYKCNFYSSILLVHVHYRSSPSSHFCLQKSDMRGKQQQQIYDRNQQVSLAISDYSLSSCVHGASSQIMENQLRLFTEKPLHLNALLNLSLDKCPQTPCTCLPSVCVYIQKRRCNKSQICLVPLLDALALVMLKAIYNSATFYLSHWGSISRACVMTFPLLFSAYCTLTVAFIFLPFQIPIVVLW